MIDCRSNHVCNLRRIGNIWLKMAAPSVDGVHPATIADLRNTIATAIDELEGLLAKEVDPAFETYLDRADKEKLATQLAALSLVAIDLNKIYRSLAVAVSPSASSSRQG